MSGMLLRKLLRDFRTNWAPYLACVLVMAFGLTMYTAMTGVVDNLASVRDKFYDDYNFADAFSTVTDMPVSELESLASLGGIAQVAGRQVVNCHVTDPEGEGNVTLRLVSSNVEPGDRDQNPLNGYQILQGSPPVGAQILVGSGFFDAHGLELGDTVTVVIHGRETELTIAGVAQGPEYVYAIEGGASVYPDPKNFDIAYVPYEYLSAALGKQGKVNDVSFGLAEGTRYSQVSAILEERLKPYGLLSLISRGDQLSAEMMRQEIDSMRAMSGTVPPVFLLISAFILYIMVRRMIEQQRGQIGTLKAFGFNNRRIITHYTGFGAILGIAGGLAGGVFGLLLAGPMTDLYKAYFNLPELHGNASPMYLVTSLMMSLPFGAISSLLAARDIIRLRPVEAMSPPAPRSGKRIFVERIKPVWNLFTSLGHMALRNIARAPGRSAFTGMGVMFAFAMSAVILSMNSMMDAMMIDFVSNVQRYDSKVYVQGYADARSLAGELRSDSAVKLCEPVLELPVRLMKDNKHRNIVAIGLPDGSQLFRLHDSSGRRVEVPPDGCILTKTAADKLGVGPGDTVALVSQVLDSDPEVRHTVTIRSVIEQNLGENVYFRLESLGGIFRQEGIATAAMVKLSGDTEARADFADRYVKQTGVMRVENIDSIRKMYKEMMDPYNTMIYVMVFISILIGFAIIYNSTIVSLSERNRELASMRVLGFTIGETMEVLIIEQTIIALVGGALGIPLTSALMQGMSASMNTEMFSVPSGIPADALIYAGLAVLGMVALATVAVLRKVRRLDLVEVLKARE